MWVNLFEKNLRSFWDVFSDIHQRFFQVLSRIERLVVGMILRMGKGMISLAR